MAMPPMTELTVMPAMALRLRSSVGFAVEVAVAVAVEIELAKLFEGVVVVLMRRFDVEAVVGDGDGVLTEAVEVVVVTSGSMMIPGEGIFDGPAKVSSKFCPETVNRRAYCAVRDRSVALMLMAQLYDPGSSIRTFSIHRVC